MSRALCARGISCQNRIKTGLRNRLSEQNINNVMKVAIEGLPLAEFDFEREKQILKGTVVAENSLIKCSKVSPDVELPRISSAQVLSPTSNKHLKLIYYYIVQGA